MSETDSFIEEVAEEVRRDRLYGLFRKYGWIAAVVIVAIVGGAAYNEYTKASREAAAQRLGDAILSALNVGEADDIAVALSEIEADGDSAAILALIQAGASADAEDIPAADAKLDEVAANSDYPKVYRDLAKMKRLMLRGNPLSDAERTVLIDDLAIPGNAFRTLAEEQRALMLIGQGDVEGALSIFTDLIDDSESTLQLTQRARQMVVVLGGSLNQG